MTLSETSEPVAPLSAPLDEVASEISRWRACGTDGVLVRVVAYQGFGGARRGELAAMATDGSRVGRILGGSLDARVAPIADELRDRPVQMVEIDVDGGAAGRAGLSCGGRALAALQPLAAIPGSFWDALSERRAVALVSSPDGERLLVVPAEGPATGSLADPELDRFGETEARRWLSLRRPIASSTEDPHLLIQTFPPSRRMLVVGAGELAEALRAQAELVGWHGRIAATRDDAEAALTELGSSDALVMLSHDAQIDGPVLAGAHERGVGYVGALGSRGTTARRAQRLAELGVPEDWTAAIYGPIGLDIAAATPAETALAVCTEVLAAAAKRPPIHLRDRPGPINAVSLTPA